jgi:hypothetical protein
MKCVTNTNCGHHLVGVPGVFLGRWCAITVAAIMMVLVYGLAASQAALGATLVVTATSVRSRCRPIHISFICPW